MGSNSIRCQFLHYAEDGVLCGTAKRLATTHLAEGLDQSGQLSPANMARSAAAIAAFAAQARAIGVPVFAYATSATRDAGNQAEFIALVTKHAEITLDVLSGAEEARLARLGAGATALLDVGGGSTQLITEEFQMSYPMGCVRGKNLFESTQGEYAARREALEARCHALMQFPPIPLLEAVGVGGSVTTLAALHLGLKDYAREKVEGAALGLSDINSLIDHLWAMGETRRAHPLLKDRYDTILPGAIICAFVMKNAGIIRLTVSDRDGMEGYFLKLTAHTR